jgi:hypothetical protein
MNTQVLFIFLITIIVLATAIWGAIESKKIEMEAKKFNALISS